MKARALHSTFRSWLLRSLHVFCLLRIPRSLSVSDSSCILSSELLNWSVLFWARKSFLHSSPARLRDSRFVSALNFLLTLEIASLISRLLIVVEVKSSFRFRTLCAFQLAPQWNAATWSVQLNFQWIRWIPPGAASWDRESSWCLVVHSYRTTMIKRLRSSTSGVLHFLTADSR